jgi:hypothetical protein
MEKIHHAFLISLGSGTIPIVPTPGICRVAHGQ